MADIPLIHAIWDAIQNDGWMWGVCWGPNRNGKTTCTMQMSFEVYKDWDKVLDSIVFNLTDLFHKIKAGKPEAYKGSSYNRRVPLLIGDDWAVHLNKAATQHDLSLDYFKGYFQAIATDLAVLIGTMLVPTGITLQLYELYTHEIYIPQRGVYKFDKVRWQPNYNGWRVNPDKNWIETNTFEPVPVDVYKDYNEMRRALTGEAKEKVMDHLVKEIPFIIKRLRTIDFDMLQILKNRGQMSHQGLGRRFPEDLSGMRARLKSRGLITPMRQKGNYFYEITDLGLQVLETWEKDLDTVSIASTTINK